MSASKYPDPPENLIDGIARAKASPDSFEVPNPLEINEMEIGYYVKNRTDQARRPQRAVLGEAGRHRPGRAWQDFHRDRGQRSDALF